MFKLLAAYFSYRAKFRRRIQRIRFRVARRRLRALSKELEALKEQLNYEREVAHAEKLLLIDRVLTSRNQFAIRDEAAKLAKLPSTKYQVPSSKQQVTTIDFDNLNALEEAQLYAFYESASEQGLSKKEAEAAFTTFKQTGVMPFEMQTEN